MIGGDFRQIPPVLRRVDPENTRAYTLRAWKHWRSLLKIEFYRNERAIEDDKWAEFVLSVGDGAYKGFSNASDATSKDDAMHPAAVLLPPDIAPANRN